MLEDSAIQCRPFASGSDFLGELDALKPGCLLLDLKMPEIDGLTVMTEMARRRVDWPVVVVTGDADVPAAVAAMKLGAIDFLQKPFSEETLRGCLKRGFHLLGERTKVSRRKNAAEGRLGILSARETEILRGLLAGFSNKVLAARLGISLRTVEMHRGNMMDRLEVGSLAEALTLAMEGGLEPMPPAPKSPGES